MPGLGAGVSEGLIVVLVASAADDREDVKLDWVAAGGLSSSTSPERCPSKSEENLGGTQGSENSINFAATASRSMTATTLGKCASYTTVSSSSYKPSGSLSEISDIFLFSMPIKSEEYSKQEKDLPGRRLTPQVQNFKVGSISPQRLARGMRYHYRRQQVFWFGTNGTVHFKSDIEKRKSNNQ